MDTISNEYIQDYLHSDRFIDMLEYFIAKYSESADSIKKRDCIRVQNFWMMRKTNY